MSSCEVDVELSKINFLRKKKIKSQEALSWEVGQGEYIKNNYRVTNQHRIYGEEVIIG